MMLVIYRTLRAWLHNLFEEQAKAEAEYAELLMRRGIHPGEIQDTLQPGPGSDGHWAERS